MESHSASRSETPLIIAVIVAALVCLASALYLFVFRVAPVEEVIKTDVEKLTAHSWEKEGSPTVIWTFKSDGTGELTTNKSNYYDFSWQLEPFSNASGSLPDSIHITTSWLYDLDDWFSYEFVEENLVLKNLSDDLESTFLPLGTQAELEPSNSTEETPEE